MKKGKSKAIQVTPLKMAKEVHAEVAFRIRFYRNIGSRDAEDAMIELQRELMQQGLSIFNSLT